jgi:hypothetical protein
MQVGARASDVGRTGLMNIGFILFELLGLSGLGPGRLDLREHGAQALAGFLPEIVLGMLAAIILLVAGWARWKHRLTSRHFGFFFFAVVVPFALVMAAGAAGHVRLLGRHLTPLLPWLLAWTGAGLASLFSAGLWKRVLAGALLFLLFLSALEIRFAPRHRRDDYRSAAAIARAEVESAHRVWWLADRSTGVYYHLPVESALIVTSPKVPPPNESPAMVILSKPDIYDGSGAARAYLAAQRFKIERVLPAFQIWTRSLVR